MNKFYCLSASACIAFSVLVLVFGQGARAENADSVVRSVISNSIQPAFAQFSQSAENAKLSVETLCRDANPAQLKQTQHDFRALVDRWSRAELFRFGPLMVDNRLERILFWPDRRSLGLRQVQSALFKKDQTVANLDTLQSKSVALQGLAALEYVLFGKGSQALENAGTDGSFRCRYGLTIAQNIAQIGQELANYWADENEYIKNWLAPSAANPLVRDNTEQLSIVLKIFGDGAEILNEQRLSPFIKTSQEAARPKSALFWRSNMSLPNIIAGIETLDKLLEISNLDRLVSGNHNRELSAVRFEFANAIRALKSSYGDGERDLDSLLVDDDAYSELNYAGIVLHGLVDNLRGPIPTMFGIVTGFSSLDGD